MSLNEWATNREDADKSIGPRTGARKQRSSRKALRHGLTAETVIDGVEDTADYRAFEATIVADYDPRTAVERELVLRLASLLWRIRRATAIETDLFRIQAEALDQRHQACAPTTSFHDPSRDVPCRVIIGRRLGPQVRPGTDQHRSGGSCEHEPSNCRSAATEPSRRLTHCFLRLANLDNAVFERIGRYEWLLCRQIAQMQFALEPLRHRLRRL
jgi:hypothetical protein